MQALQQNTPLDTAKLVTAIRFRVTRLKEEAQNVTLAWIPSHVGTSGKESINIEVKRALTQSKVRMDIPLSLQLLKRLTKKSTG